MEKPNPPSGKGTTTIPLSNPLRQYLMGSDISSDESLQVTPVKASPVIFENAHAKSTPIPKNGIFPNHEQNFSPEVYSDYTQHSLMFSLGKNLRLAMKLKALRMIACAQTHQAQ